MSEEDNVPSVRDGEGLLDSLGVTTVDASKVEQSVLARVGHLLSAAA